jgi:asparagine synthase (glutamine-hydrolysing)
MPGHYLVVEDGEVTVEQYWSYPVPSSARPLVSVDSAAEGLVEELDTAVRLHLMADVPLGAMLSGGIDSSLIVALMARNMSQPVKTFTVGFRDTGVANELEDARRIASHLGADHHEVELSLDDRRLDLEHLIWHMDEPVADLSSIGFLAVSELASEHVKVALCGQGADELLGGYKRYRAAALAARWHKLPSIVRVTGRRVANIGPKRLQRSMSIVDANSAADQILLMSGHMTNSARGRLLCGPLADSDGSSARRVLDRLDGNTNTLSAMLSIDGQLGLVDDMLHYFDRFSMARSLEVRVPFLDHSVVEYCAALPGGYKVKGLTTKYVLKRAARGLIPDWVINKPKIGFFDPIVDQWLQAHSASAIDRYLRQPELACGHFVDRVELGRLIDEQATLPRRGGGHVLLSILMLELWLSTYLPHALDAKPVAARI